MSETHIGLYGTRPDCGDSCWCRHPGMAREVLMNRGQSHVSVEDELARFVKPEPFIDEETGRVNPFIDIIAGCQSCMWTNVGGTRGEPGAQTDTTLKVEHTARVHRERTGHDVVVVREIRTMYRGAKPLKKQGLEALHRAWELHRAWDGAAVAAHIMISNGVHSPHCWCMREPRVKADHPHGDGPQVLGRLYRGTEAAQLGLTSRPHRMVVGSGVHGAPQHASDCWCLKGE